MKKAKKIENAIEKVFVERKYLTEDLGGTSTTEEFTRAL